MERLNNRYEKQGNKINEIEEENGRLAREKGLLRAEIEDLTKKLRLANENYKELKIMIARSAQEKHEEDEKASNSKDLEKKKIAEKLKREEESEIEALRLVLLTRDQEVLGLKNENEVNLSSLIE